MEKSDSSWNVYFLSVFCHTAHFFLLGQQQILLILRKLGYARHESQHGQQRRKKEKIHVKKKASRILLCILGLYAFFPSLLLDNGPLVSSHQENLLTFTMELVQLLVFFSEDSVTLGDLVVKDQVCSFIYVVLCSKFLTGYLL